MPRMESESALSSRLRAMTRCGGVTLTESHYDPNLHLPRHTHDFSKISLIVRGGVTESSARGEQSAGPGDVVFKPAGIDHTDTFAPRATLIFSIRAEKPKSELSEMLLRRTSDYAWVRSRAVTRAMFSAFFAFRHRAEGDSSAVDETLHELAAIGSDGRIRTARPPLRSRILEDACEYVRANCDGALQVQQIAEQVGTHPIYLTRLFRRRLGCNVSAFVRRERLRRAAELLSETATPPAQIAAATGFADQPHFCRTLRREFGLTPLAYRSLFRK